MKDIIFSCWLIVIVLSAFSWFTAYTMKAYNLAENTSCFIELAIYFGIVFLIIISLSISILVDAVRKYKQNKK